MKTKLRATWRNTIKKYKTHPLKYIEPRSLQDIRDVITEAEGLGFNVRAVGSGHSFSDIAITDGYLLDLKKLDRLLPLPARWLKAGDHSRLVSAEAGMTIERFNRLMNKQGLCVLNMGGIDHQTLAGAISTGTHGTGIELPGIHGMVRSVVLVTSGGKVCRIEPGNGITDPENYGEPGVELVQDDDRFNSVLVNLGCMGVIYSFILELEPMYWLRESKKLGYWHEVRARLADRSLFERDEQGRQKYRGIMVQISPYPDKSGHRRCLVVRHELLRQAPEFRFGDLFRNIFTRLGNMPLFYWLSVILVRLLPRAIPWLINNSLRSVKDKSYIHKGYKVLHQGVEYVKIRAYDTEFALDMNRHAADAPPQEQTEMPHTPDNNFLDALDELMDRAWDLAENHQLYQSAPFGMRFMKGSSGFLCPGYQKTVCYIDTPFLLHTIGSDEILNQYQDIMFRYDGIPHWGKIHNRLFRYPELIARFYPYMDKWLESFYHFNPKGTFSNTFSDRLIAAQKACATFQDLPDATKGPLTGN